MRNKIVMYQLFTFYKQNKKNEYLLLKPNTL